MIINLSLPQLVNISPRHVAVFMKDYLRDWISSQQPLSRRRRTRKRPLVQRAVSNPVSAQTPQQVQVQPMSEQQQQQQQQQHYQAIQMQQQAHTAAILAARANAHQLPAAMVIPQHQQSGAISNPMPVPIQVPLPVSTLPAAELATAMKQKNISMEV